MKHSQRPSKSSADSPVNPPRPPSIADTRRSIVRHVVRGAVAALDDALRAEAEAREGFFAEDDECDPMMDVIAHRVRDARRTLVRAILSIGPTGLPVLGNFHERYLCATSGVQVGGRFYMVVPDPLRKRVVEPEPSDDDDLDPYADPVMTLVVVDRAAVADLEDAEDAPIHDLDEG